MSEFRLNIRTNGAAFEHYPEHEIARILQEVADRIKDFGVGTSPASALDYNGNSVCSYEIVE